MLRTSRELKVKFREYGDLTIPKGIRLSHMTTCGYDPDYHFIADFSWVDKSNSNLLHDLIYYGYNVPKKFVTEEVTKC